MARDILARRIIRWIAAEIFLVCSLVDANVVDEEVSGEGHCGQVDRLEAL